MRPILLKGHERSITSIKYNFEGDLLFSTSKHPTFAVWFASNGERLGTYQGHTGTVWSIAVNRKTTRVVTGSGDTYAKMWEAETGKEVASLPHKAPVRYVDYSYGEKELLTVTDQVLGFLPSIYIYDLDGKNTTPVMEIKGKNESKILQASWNTLNREIVTANEDGTIRVYDVRTGEQLHVITDHAKSVMQLSFNADKTLFVTASKDGTSKLYDAKEYKNLKTYHTGRPINSASISPIKEEIVLGGGQSADTVTTTRVENSQFRARFFHSIYEEELGSIQGHFGPVNVISYSPDGKSFASGGEDGYVRLHHFDPSYFTNFGKIDSK